MDKDNNDTGEVTVRRAFKKSRNGCISCKARKVKCDEKRPLCGNCARRYIGLKSCSFHNFVNFTAQKTLPLAPRVPTPEGCSQSETSKTLELRLLHHYTLFTATQLPSGPTEHLSRVWAVDVPRFGFSSQLVLHALLAISAQHLWALDPSNVMLAQASRRYLDSAITQHRKALKLAERPCSSGEVETLLAAAILITHHTWTAAHADAICKIKPYAIHLQTYYMARGLQQLFEGKFPLLKNSALLWYRPQEFDTTVCGTTEDPFVASAKVDLDILLRAANEAGGCEQDTFRKVADELMSIYPLVCTHPSRPGIHNRIATLPLQVPARFLQLLEVHDPIALALLARNLALLKMVDHKWWLHGAGEHQVAERALYGIASLMPQMWAWTMEWPLNFLQVATQVPANREQSSS